MSDKPDVRPGIADAIRRELDAKGVGLRDRFAGIAMGGVLQVQSISAAIVGMANAATGAKNEVPDVPPSEIATYSYDVADAMMRHRVIDAAERDGLRRLAAIGSLCVKDWIGTGDINVVSQELQRALESFVAELKSADTEPAGPPDDASHVDDAKQSSLAKMGRNNVQFYLDTGECLMCEMVGEGEHDDDCPVGEFVQAYPEKIQPSADDAPSEAPAVPDGATPVFTSASGAEPAGFATSQQIGTTSDGTPVMGLGPMVGKARGEGGST